MKTLIKVTSQQTPHLSAPLTADSAERYYLGDSDTRKRATAALPAILACEAKPDLHTAARGSIEAEAYGATIIQLRQR